MPQVHAQMQDQHIKVALRTIGHTFLLQSGDSTSRILPIEKINGRYAMQFETSFSYQPDLLSISTLEVLERNQISESFIVEVEKCGTSDVVHSFEASLQKKDSPLPCSGRALSKGCYIFYFTIIENHTIVQPTEKSLSSAFNYMYALLALILIVGFIVYFRRRKGSLKLKSDFINIGQYQFDQKGMLLILKAQTVELSSKESDLLYLLASNENKTLEREYILNVVWGDAGDYVGRTLDVFISKLRKKLEADATVKIINIRGVGYRFVIN